MSDTAPRWMYQTTGELKDAVSAYLVCDPLSREQITMLRDYFREWISAPGFSGPAVDTLRIRVDGLMTRTAIDDWLNTALLAGVDPL